MGQEWGNLYFMGINEWMPLNIEIIVKFHELRTNDLSACI